MRPIFMTDKNEKIEEEMKRIIAHSPAPTDLAHSQSTRKWVLKLKPDADLALEIAALAHDIERGLMTPKQELDKEDFSNYEAVKKAHGRKSADIICDLLKKHGFEGSLIKRVRDLVEHHEFGGDPDADVLKDADSISFFEKNLEYYFKKFGKSDAQSKIEFMFKWTNY